VLIHRAIFSRQWVTVQQLIQGNHRSLREEDDDGNTAIIWAVQQQHVPTLTALLHTVPETINHVNNASETALMIACDKEYTEIVQLLVADQHLQADHIDAGNGMSSLGFAILRNNFHLLKLLVPRVSANHLNHRFALNDGVLQTAFERFLWNVLPNVYHADIPLLVRQTMDSFLRRNDLRMPQIFLVRLPHIIRHFPALYNRVVDTWVERPPMLGPAEPCPICTEEDVLVQTISIRPDGRTADIPNAKLCLSCLKIHCASNNVVGGGLNPGSMRIVNLSGQHNDPFTNNLIIAVVINGIPLTYRQFIERHLPPHIGSRISTK
jgi:hypothetical protein